MKGTLVTINGLDYDEYTVETKKQTVIVRELIDNTQNAPVETLESKMESLKAQNLILMDAVATLYEEMLAKGVL